MKVRILFDINDNVLKVVPVETDIDVLIKTFIEEEIHGKLSDIEYWEGGSYTYDLINNESEYDIFITGDNGNFEMYTDTYEVDGFEDIIKTKDKIIDSLYNQLKVLLNEINNLKK